MYWFEFRFQCIRLRLETPVISTYGSAELYEHPEHCILILIKLRPYQKTYFIE
jgi:hypothetical protein